VRAWLPPQRLDPKTREELLALLEAPVPGGPAVTRGIEEVRRVPSHALLMKLLMQAGMSEDEAARHWKSLCAHREALTEKLGRDPGASVAALDYFDHQEGFLANPVLLDGLTAERTLASASRDGLTGLVSPRHFQVLLRREIRRAARSAQGFSLALLDLDDFGRLNRRCGRGTGDAVLKEVARILKARLRDPDVAGRADGAHFTLILPGTRRTGAYVVAERIRMAVEERFRQPLENRERLLLSLSVGTATFPQDGETQEQLVNHASLALAAARGKGGNQVALDDHDQRGAIRLRPLGRSVAVTAMRAPGEEPLRLKAVELSGTGALLESHFSFRIGEVLELVFPDLFPSPGPGIPARVERQWRAGPEGERNEDGIFRVGLRFLPEGSGTGGGIEAVLASIQARGIEQGDS
jgi:diguanylate cyclase (GGDEF)-like protein